MAIQRLLQVEDLAGKSFLDAGCGSGLSSLAARRLGASVVGFDYDPDSVACSMEMCERFAAGDEEWKIVLGSVLDQRFLQSLGNFDVVYSWGVVHHTGAMWRGLEGLVQAVANGGTLVVALYNDQGWTSGYWRFVKRTYVRYPLLRWPWLLWHLPYLICLRAVVRLIQGRGRLERGMSLWYDMRDWIGGYPFEVARPEQVLSFFRERGFELVNLKTCGGRHGCNEYVFWKAQSLGEKKIDSEEKR